MNKLWGIRVEAGGRDAGTRRLTSTGMWLSRVLHPCPQAAPGTEAPAISSPTSTSSPARGRGGVRRGGLTWGRALPVELNWHWTLGEAGAGRGLVRRPHPPSSYLDVERRPARCARCPRPPSLPAAEGFRGRGVACGYRRRRLRGRLREPGRRRRASRGCSGTSATTTARWSTSRVARAAPSGAEKIDRRSSSRAGAATTRSRPPNSRPASTIREGSCSRALPNRYQASGTRRSRPQPHCRPPQRSLPPTTQFERRRGRHLLLIQNLAAYRPDPEPRAREPPRRKALPRLLKQIETTSHYRYQEGWRRRHSPRAKYPFRKVLADLATRIGRHLLRELAGT